MLSFQRLDVYQLAITFFATMSRLAGNLPRGYGPMVDQLRRAALSVPLNIAEGAGRGSTADAARCYAIARGSTMECVAVIDALAALELVTAQEREEFTQTASRIVAMLTRLSSR